MKLSRRSRRHVQLRSALGGAAVIVFAAATTAVAGRLSLVAWRTAHGVYWVSNTLTDTLSGAQMVAIAASFTEG